jgi:hypothetical protein
MGMSETSEHPNPGSEQTRAHSRPVRAGTAYEPATEQHTQVDGAQVFTIPSAGSRPPAHMAGRLPSMSWGSIAFGLLAGLMVLFAIYAIRSHLQEEATQHQGRGVAVRQAKGASPTSTSTRAPTHPLGTVHLRHRQTVACPAPGSTPRRESVAVRTPEASVSEPRLDTNSGPPSSVPPRTTEEQTPGGLFSP